MGGRVLTFFDDLPVVGMGFGSDAGMLFGREGGFAVWGVESRRSWDVGSDRLPGRHDPKVKNRRTHTHATQLATGESQHQTPGAP